MENNSFVPVNPAEGNVFTFMVRLDGGEGNVFTFMVRLEGGERNKGVGTFYSIEAPW